MQIPACGGAGLEGVAAAADHVDFSVLGVDIRFHNVLASAWKKVGHDTVNHLLQQVPGGANVYMTKVVAARYGRKAGIFKKNSYLPFLGWGCFLGWGGVFSIRFNTSSIFRLSSFSDMGGVYAP